MSDCILSLIVSPRLEPGIVEWLLEREDVPGFSSLPIAGHGSSEHSLTLAEQVTGRSRRVMFLIELPEEVAERVLGDLAEAFHGSGLHYWINPVIRAGHLT